MTGPEHYREAERLLAGTNFKIEGEVFHNPPSEMDVARAQVHATLALAAATAMGAPVDGEADSGLPPADAKAWNQVAGVNPKGGNA